MLSASKPANEFDRLQALRDLELLDTPPEEIFDAITSVAADLFDVPIALISLVADDRQWFKARHGLEAQETGRDISFCAHAILSPSIFEIPDARCDVRFADNPLVTGAPHIRFYAGAPLLDKHRLPLGTLCIIDRKPRTLSATAREQLLDLAQAVAAIFAVRLRDSDREAYRCAIRANDDACARLAAHGEQLRTLVSHPPPGATGE